MLINNQLVNHLSKKIESSLVDELLEEYQALKKNHYLRNYELAINRAGKFVEVVFKILEFLLSGKKINTPNFNEICQKLLQTRKKDYPEAIRVIIPRAAKVIYAIRSKRGTAHKKLSVLPNKIDSTIVSAIADWILSEFVRLFSSSSLEEIESALTALVERKIPIIEEFGEKLLVLKKNLSASKEILLVLYWKYPYFVEEKLLKDSIITKSFQNIMTSLNNLAMAKLVFRENKRCKLTQAGLHYVESKIDLSNFVKNYTDRT